MNNRLEKSPTGTITRLSRMDETLRAIQPPAYSHKTNSRGEPVANNMNLFAGSKAVMSAVILGVETCERTFLVKLPMRVIMQAHPDDPISVLK